MAWTPPINRRENRNLLDKRRFFKLLSEKCVRFTDKETAYLVYMMTVELVGQELNRHGLVRLPHLGDFGMVEQKARPGWCGKAHVRMGPRKVLKFYPDYFARRQYNERQDF